MTFIVPKTMTTRRGFLLPWLYFCVSGIGVTDSLWTSREVFVTGLRSKIKILMSK